MHLEKEPNNLYNFAVAINNDYEIVGCIPQNYYRNNRDCTLDLVKSWHLILL